MIDTSSVPDATAPAEYHADFLELSTLRSHKRGLSFQEFLRDLRIGSAAEVIADSLGSFEDSSETDAEAIAQAAFDEVDERRRHFGPFEAEYPFRLTDQAIQLRPGGEQTLYTYLALLSWCGKDAGPHDIDGEKIFEEVCAKAAEAYLGGPDDRVMSRVFGFPRRFPNPTGFTAALDELCRALGEGGGHRPGQAKLAHQKDARLDVVVWVKFLDARAGMVITFGQCATGKNWVDKLFELPPPERWCTHWMAENPTVPPLRSFFVPHRIEREKWRHACDFGGILFDRCRIASFGSGIQGQLKTQWGRWSNHVLRKLGRASP